MKKYKIPVRRIAALSTYQKGDNQNPLPEIVDYEQIKTEASYNGCEQLITVADLEVYAARIDAFWLNMKEVHDNRIRQLLFDESARIQRLIKALKKQP